jgi:uncharacterized damage-inducible protein DinB
MRLLLRDIAAVRREIESYPDDESVWELVEGISNSGGTLALHLCGNLSHFVGATLGNTGYVRNRDVEFSQRGISRAALSEQLTATETAIRSTLGSLPDEKLHEGYPIAVGGVTAPTGIFLMHLATHLAYHLGQIDYHRRITSKSTTTVNTISIPPLVSPLDEVPVNA